MKKLILPLAIILILFSSCGGSSDDSPFDGGLSGDIGTFTGNLQITDDPQTDLGRVFNTRVQISVDGTKGRVRITGDSGFNREFTGEVRTNIENTLSITLLNQISPIEKNVSGDAIIISNEATISINLPDA